eukprot:gene12694-biopygen16954
MKTSGSAVSPARRAWHSDLSERSESDLYKGVLGHTARNTGGFRHPGNAGYPLSELPRRRPPKAPGAFEACGRRPPPPPHTHARVYSLTPVTNPADDSRAFVQDK